ncbi:MAG: hypothetical protein IPQ05_20495 [Leptospiraceae bacterium]|nr:hypothetical protein [Leptospiraceae bacterium]
MSEENNSRTNIEEDFDDGFNPDDLVNDEKNESSNINPGFVSKRSQSQKFCSANSNPCIYLGDTVLLLV